MVRVFLLAVVLLLLQVDKALNNRVKCSNARLLIAIFCFNPNRLNI